MCQILTTSQRAPDDVPAVCKDVKKGGLIPAVPVQPHPIWAMAHPGIINWGGGGGLVEYYLQILFQRRA